MTTYYARAGGGNWTTASTWSLSSNGPADGAVPGTGDDVIFDASSGNVTCISGQTCRNATFTGYTGTLTQTGTVIWNVYGSLLFDAGMTYTVSATADIDLEGTATGNTITTAGLTMPGQFNMNGSGEWILQDDWTGITSTSNSTMSAGTLDCNGFALTVGRLVVSGTATIQDFSVLSSISATGATISGGTISSSGDIDFLDDLSITGSTYSVTVNNLDCVAFTTTSTGGSLTVNGTFTSSTYSQSAAGSSVSVGGFVVAGSLTHTGGTLTVGAGGVVSASYNQSSSTTRTINMGSGTWQLTGTGNVWINSNNTGLTLNEDTSTIRLSNTSATTKTFQGNGNTFYNLYIDGAASNATVTITGSNTFNAVTLEPYVSLLLTNGTTQTIAVPPTWTGASGQNISIKGVSANADISVASGTVDCDWLTLQLVTGTGGATFYAGSNSTDNGSVVGWSFTDAPAGGSTIPVFMHHYIQQGMA